MPKLDEALKNMFKDKEKYADLFNGTLFNGEEIIDPQYLTEVPTEHILVNKEKGAHGTRHRDLIMKFNDNLCHLILGCENQSTTDYTMPVRTMVYDAMTYQEQIREGELKQTNGKYYRGKVDKKWKIVPVLTLVAYWGKTPWTAKTSLHEMMDWPENYPLKKYISDYHINVVDMTRIENKNLFKNDLQTILNCLEYKQDKVAFNEYIATHQEEIQRLDRSSEIAMMELLEEPDLEPYIKGNEKGEIGMCKAIRDLVEDGRQEGKQEGRQELSHQWIVRMARKGYEIEQICDVSEMSKEEIERILKGSK